MLYTDFYEQYFTDANEQVFGTFDIDRGEISTTGEAVWTAQVNETGDNWAAFGMAGEFAAGESISGMFQANWAGWMHVEERVGTVSMNYHSIYERPSSLVILQGSYRTSEEVLTIDAQGVIFYQSAVTGCTGSGAAEIIDPDYNMYRVEIGVDNCTGDEAVRNGLIFSGLANIGDHNEPGGGFINATLEIAVSAARGLPFGQGYVPWSVWLNKD